MPLPVAFASQHVDFTVTLCGFPRVEIRVAGSEARNFSQWATPMLGNHVHNSFIIHYIPSNGSTSLCPTAIWKFKCLLDSCLSDPFGLCCQTCMYVWMLCCHWDHTAHVLTSLTRWTCSQQPNASSPRPVNIPVSTSQSYHPYGETCFW